MPKWNPALHATAGPKVRRLTVCAAAVAICITAAGCGDESKIPASNGAATTSGTTSHAGATAAAKTSRRIDVGYATFLMPEGWIVKPYRAQEAGPDAIEGYAASPTEAATAEIAKGGFSLEPFVTVTSFPDRSGTDPSVAARELAESSNNTDNPAVTGAKTTLAGDPAALVTIERDAQVRITVLRDGRSVAIAAADSGGTDLDASRKLVESVRRSWRWADR